MCPVHTGGSKGPTLVTPETSHLRSATSGSDAAPTTIASSGDVALLKSNIVPSGVYSVGASNVVARF